MNAIIYPLHLRRTFERRWAARATRDETRRSPSQGTDICGCGNLVTAPASPAYLPTGKIMNRWRCTACGASWEMFVDPASSNENSMNQSELLRKNAENCLTLEEAAPSAAARNRFKRMGDAWYALAETQDWLDGVISPIRPRHPQRTPTRHEAD